jgi:hypothetical protein
MTTERAGAERQRLAEAREGVPWRKWGPYLSERQWGTVREDYSEDSDAWNSFPHDHARSRAYRWGEDGLAGLSDDKQRLCFALALWNGADPILKERLFGLTNDEGNHGEDVKDYYFYLDSTPTHSYMKDLYKYPQAAYPYSDLVETNRHRTRNEMEYELLDTGVFQDDRLPARARPGIRRRVRPRGHPAVALSLAGEAGPADLGCRADLPVPERDGRRARAGQVGGRPDGRRADDVRAMGLRDAHQQRLVVRRGERSPGRQRDADPALRELQLPNAWYVGSAPIITANWEGDSDNRWTVPLGVNLGKIVRLGKRPVNAQVGGYYNVVRPDNAAEW